MKRTFPYLVVIVMALAVLIANIWWIHIKKTRLLECDHPAVLAACRQLLADSDEPSSGRNQVVLRPPYSDTTPRILQEMKPRYIVVQKDRVLLRFGSMPKMYLNAFRKGAEEYGKRELIDGLWYD